MSLRCIKFPYSAAGQFNIKAQFAVRGGFPNVFGVINFTHIVIEVPSHDGFVYASRKHFHSINVLIVCDAQMKLTNIVARWPGSIHVTYILSNSIVGNKLQAGTVSNGWLLGE